MHPQRRASRVIICAFFWCAVLVTWSESCVIQVDEVAVVLVDVGTLADDFAASTKEVPAIANLPHVLGSLLAEVRWVDARFFYALPSLDDSRFQHQAQQLALRVTLGVRQLHNAAIA